MIRAAILGCGPRANGHAAVYRGLEGGQLVAICDMNEERLRTFGERHGVAAQYTDLEMMLRQERPDLLHIVTLPALRVPLLEVASAHEVPGVIVEKPIALDGRDYRALRALAAKTRSKIAVNHQLHFHPRSLELQAAVHAGEIGRVRAVDASARLNLSGQGTHVLELVAAYTQQASPVVVFGQCAGPKGLETNHPAPDSATAEVQLEGGVTAVLRCGPHAPRISDEPAGHRHKRVAVYGDLGLVQWTMTWWERSRADGSVAKGEHDYGVEDRAGQAGLTEAMFRWIQDDAAVHPTNLNASLDQFQIILALYTSALEHRPVEFPFEPAEELLEPLRRHLS